MGSARPDDIWRRDAQRNRGIGRAYPVLKSIPPKGLPSTIALAARYSLSPSMTIEIVRTPVLRSALQRVAAARFGDMVKAVVDVRRRIMAIGGELHADEEALLIDDGSRQDDLWGINLYPAEGGDEWIEYDSMINVRPSQGNRSRGVDNGELRHTLRTIVGELVREPSGP